MAPPPLPMHRTIHIPMLRLLVFAVAGLLVSAGAHGQARRASLQIYPVQTIYPLSNNFALSVNGQSVPVTSFRKYDIAQFSLGLGEARISISRNDGIAIKSALISPRKLNLRGEMNGQRLVFIIHSPNFLIVKVDSLPELVLAIDPPPTNIPIVSGKEVFNISDATYGAIAGNNYSTKAFQRALDDASKWGTKRRGTRKGTVYVPAGLWTVGSLYLSSNTNLYLAPGAVLRFTGEASHYKVDGHKDSQHRDLTWFISTRPHSENISITGRGTIDGNGLASLKVSNLGVNLLAPVLTTHFTVDGITFRESSSWGVIPTRSRDLSFTDIKIFNGLDMGEDDGIDIVESSDVLVRNAIAIALDDPFSTKTWQSDTDMFKAAPGNPQPLQHVRIEHVIAWTRCYGLKVGQGVVQPQNDVIFSDATVYDAAVGFGIHHKWGSSPATNVTFRDIDIEHLCCTNDNNRTWMALWMENTPGPQPIDNITVSNIHIWDAGGTSARINGIAGSPITHVKLENIFMPGESGPANTLSAMHITGDTFHDTIAIDH
jgi:hypothetical protein